MTEVGSHGLNWLSEVKVSPYTLVNSAFLLVAPFLSWITLNLFGVYESNLWQISISQVPMQIPPSLALASSISGGLLIAGAILALVRLRPSLLLQAFGLILFLATSYSLFGYVRSGLVVFLVSPGIGLILASVGIAIGLFSIWTEKLPLGKLYRGLRTREGIYKSGLFIASIAFLVDGFDHAALGQLAGFFGASFLEEFIHLGFLIPLLLLVIAAGSANMSKQNVLVSGISGIVFLFLGMDAIYHTFLGSILTFLGHTPEEIVLHLAAYYGVAFLIISRFFMRP